MHMHLRAKMGAAIITLGAMLLLCGAVGYLGTQKLSDSLSFVTTKAWDAADGTMEGTIGIQRELLAVEALVNIHQPNEAERMQLLNDIGEAKRFAAEALSRAKQSGLMPNEQIAVLDRSLEEEERLQRRLLETTQTADSEALSRTRDDYRRHVHELLKMVGELERFGDAQVEDQSTHVASVTRTVRYSLVATLLLGLLVAVAALWFGIKYIIEPITAVSGRLRDIAEGEGDLTVSIDVKGNDETSELSRAFNAFVGKIRGLVGKVADSTTQLAASSEETTVITSTANNEADRQKQEAELISTAITEMMHSAHEVARSADGAAAAVRSADEAAVAGSQVVTATSGAITALAREVGGASDAMMELARESDHIGKILDVIRDITEQTNLLALNAAIEAARAGEQGRGFAVVADEVRTLAQRTQASTLEVQNMIQRLQNGTTHAVQAMEKGRQRANQCAIQFGEADNAFKTIVESVRNATDMTVQIAAAAEQQNVVSSEIERNVHNIRDAAENSANSTRELLAANHNIASLAGQLHELVQTFKI